MSFSKIVKFYKLDGASLGRGLFGLREGKIAVVVFQRFLFVFVQLPVFLKCN